MGELDDNINFVIDVEPIVDFRREKRKVPLYTVSHDYTVEKNKDIKNEDSRKSKSIQKCWNCSGEGHNMQMCKAPRNPTEVQRNRKAFMDAKERKGDSRNPKRYHEQNEQKYARLKPGIISRRLRYALGLKRNQLPRHVYNMRNLGYPPGWLKEAEVLPSKIQMYDGTGERVPDPDDEEGEIESIHVKYNFDLIVDYPGFNVPPTEDILEEGHIFQVPLMREDQSKESMIECMSKKGQMYELGPKNINSSSVDETENVCPSEDMDAEEIPELVVLPAGEKCEFVPPLPTEELPPPPPVEEELLRTVGQGGPEAEADDEESFNDTASGGIEGTPTSFGTPKASAHNNLGKIKSVSLGTPILKSASPYSKVPSFDKFSKGMGEVLNFENLPGSTGTYDKMLKILEKVRNSIMRKD